MAARQKILIVDDDENISELISLYLTKEFYDTKIVHDGEEALRQFRLFSPNLILLDLMLPGIDGYQVCREIRQQSSVPIIMLSAKGEVFDKVLGLELGADDYISKPFRVRELLARVKSVLRRYSKDNADGIVKIGELSVNTAEARVLLRGEEVILTAMEYRLLLSFVNNRGTVLTRRKLLEEIWDVDGDFVNDNTLTVYIKRLRDKIENDPNDPQYIKTVRGMGYLMK